MKPDIRPDTRYKKGRIYGTTLLTMPIFIYFFFITCKTWEPFPCQLFGKEHISQLGLSVRLDGIVGCLLKVDVVEIHLPALMSQRAEGGKI